MMLLALLVITTFLPSAAALSCSDCHEVNCTQPANCKGSLVPDPCGCCKLCAKVEGESCGGTWYTEGICDNGLKCVVTDKETEKGHCRRAESLCKKKKCGFRQQCIVTKHKKAVCICPRNCRESKQDPVCGYKNGKQYRNTCELYRHECRSRKEIGYYSGPCKRCFYRGKEYRMKEARKGVAPCETCVCRHGDWICSAKKPCKESLEFCTVFDDPSSGKLSSTCPAGFMCKVQIPSIPEQNIPGVGKCVPRNLTVANATSSKNMTTARSSKTAIDNMCELPVKPGACRASIIRWYYNTNRKKCLKFTYGGCDGNANNFRTKSSCRNTCMRRKGQSTKATKPPMSTLTSKRNTKPTRRPKTTEKVKNMTAICHLPPAPGPCRAAMPQWYYNPKKQRCSRFIYGGCGGNDNNFDSKDECKAACMRNKGNKPLTHTTEPVSASLSSEPSTPPSTTTPTTTRKRSTRQQSTRKPTIKTQKSSTQRLSTTSRTTSDSTTQPLTQTPTPTPKRRLRSKKAFKCPCSECKWQTGKSTCRTHYGCFTSQIKHADGRVTYSHGCLEDEEHYSLLCNVRKPDQRQPRMILECCRGHMCNFNDILVNDGMRGRSDGLRTLPQSTTTQVPTLKQKSTKSASPDQPGCYDAHNNKFFGESEEWKPNDCTVCSCKSGEPTCVATVCKHPRCLDPIRIQGQCCPVCNKNGNITEDSQEMIKALSQSQLTTVLVSIKKPTDQRFCEDLNTGELYLSGQNWKVDDCTTCYCQRDGKIACAVQMCSGYPGCSNPVKEKGQCCPVCKDERDEETNYPEHEAVESPNSCLDSVTGDYYRRSEMWQQDDCTACICGADRKYQCRKTKCKELSCAETIKLKGRCCPSCASDTKAGCSFEGQKFLQGEYKLLADHCTLCECRNSEWICSSRRCGENEKQAV